MTLLKKAHFGGVDWHLIYLFSLISLESVPPWLVASTLVELRLKGAISVPRRRASLIDNAPGDLNDFPTQRAGEVLLPGLHVSHRWYPPYHWSIATGALPNGLGINAASGMIAGQPAAAGTFGFAVSVQDSSSSKASAMVTNVYAGRCGTHHQSSPANIHEFHSPVEKLATLTTAQSVSYGWHATLSVVDRQWRFTRWTGYRIQPLALIFWPSHPLQEPSASRSAFKIPRLARHLRSRRCQ